MHDAKATPHAPANPAGAATAAPPTPEHIFQLTWSFAASQALTTAVELALFTRVAKGHKTVPALARALGAPERGVRMLVDALVGLGLLRRPSGEAAGAVVLAPDTETFLVEGKPSYVGGFVAFHGRRIAEAWQHLTEIVRTGEPLRSVDHPEEGIPLWHELVDVLFPVGYPGAQQIGRDLLRLYPSQPVRLLDVAAGSGVWGIGAAKANPSVRVTANDLSETLEHTRRWVNTMGLADRVEYLDGDLRKVDYGESRFEAAVLGHICHSEGEEGTRALMRKVARALVPGGTIFVVEFTPDEDRSSPVLPLLFAINMLVNTSAGDTFTFAQMSAWLAEAGFRDVRREQAPTPSPLIVATKA